MKRPPESRFLQCNACFTLSSIQMLLCIADRRCVHTCTEQSAQCASLQSPVIALCHFTLRLAACMHDMLAMAALLLSSLQCQRICANFQRNIWHRHCCHLQYHQPSGGTSVRLHAAGLSHSTARGGDEQPEAADWQLAATADVCCRQSC